MAKAKTSAKKTTKGSTKKSSTKATASKTSSTKKPAKKKTKKESDVEVKVDRRSPKAEDRRQSEEEFDEALEGTPDRRKVARRRQIDPTTCERDYNNDEIEFMHALDAYKRAAGRMFPTCSEILEVLRDLGYRRLTPEESAKLGFGKTDDEAVGEEGELVAAGEVNALQEATVSEGDDNVFATASSLADFEG